MHVSYPPPTVRDGRSRLNLLVDRIGRTVEHRFSGHCRPTPLIREAPKTGGIDRDKIRKT